jgi:flagellar hook assembly protein FlgD
VVTDVGPDHEDGAFFGMRLAYPNPFSNTTSVSLRLDQERAVRLLVYNVRGQMVRAVTDAKLGAGLQVLTWDGKDSTGSPVGAGIYLYRIDVDGQRVTRKVVKLQ